MASKYDFIVVGAGPAGCVLASRLAKSSSRPSVLLLEAGSPNDNAAYLEPVDRFRLSATEPSLNWGYKTEPQTQLKGQQIDYSRGKGLGGSTAINFCAWVIGASDDFEEWDKRVGGGGDWSWEKVKERFKRIENCHREVPKEHEKWVNPKAEDHGASGPLELTFPQIWEKDVVDVFLAAEQCGLGLNQDINSGNPLGMGMGPATIHNGIRVTASGAYLQNPPSNLTIEVDSPIAKVLFSEKTAIGVETIDGRQFFAAKEVLLSAGALNTPQILMLSGVGASAELAEHKIPLQHELPQVGKNLQDHCFSTCTLLQKPGTNNRMAFEADEKAMEQAREQHREDNTGMAATLYSGLPMGWFKDTNTLGSKEFKELPDHTKEYLKGHTVPSFEITTHCPPIFTGDYSLQKTDSYLSVLAFVQSPQSQGYVKLASANPTDAPLMNPKFLTHPYDKRVAIEAVRQTIRLLQAPALKANAVRLIGCPKDDSDEAIWEHIEGNLHSSWHMCSTVRMGTSPSDACVDTNFKVFGLKNLRIVDLSILPLLPNNHTQSTAYLVGETAAEKLIKEYNL